MQKKHILVEIAIYLIALLWLYTGVYKILQINYSIDQLRESPLISDFALVLGYGLPILELALFALLLFDRTRTTALWGSGILLILFTLYIVIGLVFFRRDMPCTCGGIISHLTWQNHIYFNLCFIFLSFFSLYQWKQANRNTGTKHILSVT